MFIIANRFSICGSHCSRKESSWSYGSWIYKYLCNQWLLPLKLCVRIPLMGRCTRYNIMWCQWLATGQWFFPGTLVSSTINMKIKNETLPRILRYYISLKHFSVHRLRWMTRPLNGVVNFFSFSLSMNWKFPFDL